MELPLESVPNFSEGRDAAVIKEIGRALAERAELLDVHTDTGRCSRSSAATASSSTRSSQA